MVDCGVFEERSWAAGATGKERAKDHNSVAILRFDKIKDG
jgi:hypothetical protein